MRTFSEYYETQIQPQIAAIDIYLKTEDPPYAVESVCELLQISEEEGMAFLRKEKLALITKGVFFRMLESGSAPLCGMFRRALSCNLPEQYSIEQAAYIFGLDYAAVEAAAKKMGTGIFTEKMLPQLFKNIML